MKVVARSPVPVQTLVGFKVLQDTIPQIITIPHPLYGHWANQC